MKIINSLSGGKTSSYMAKHYEADFNIFALVRIDDVNCMPKDKSLINYVSNKLGFDFIATAESDKTLLAMRELEQIIGKEIVWVSGDSFDSICLQKKALPNMFWRFCTTELKMTPIADWWLKNINEKVAMQIGFRFDEMERANNFRTDIKIKIGKHDNGRNKWQSFNWREGKFPLIDDKIGHYSVIQWAKTTNIDFPNDSNCVGCFWKPLQQLRKNWIDEPQKMQWFSDLEQKIKRRFKKEMYYEKIQRLPLQKDFYFGTGAGCNGGFCTN